jgi:hypothetical protein
MVLATAVVVGLIVAGGASSSAGAATNSSPNLSNFTCVVPSLPHGVAKASTPSTKLSGPAVTALSGGAARDGFTLDGGAVVVKPPRYGDRPLLSAKEAICGAMASTGDLSGSVAQGVAVGYGRVSVAAKFFPAITGFPSPRDLAAKYPIIRSFSNRLAWLLVVHVNPVYFN